jgi:hypothetical protein
MRFGIFAAIGGLALALTSHASPWPGEVKSSIGYQASELGDDDYHTGLGVNGSLGQEFFFTHAAGAGGFGLRANYSHYDIEGDDAGTDLNEGGVALTGLVGPNVSWFRPRFGGHAGYARLDDGNFFDFGPDFTADFNFTTQLGVQAMATPYWYSNQSHTDYQGTKLGLGVVFNLNGA